MSGASGGRSPATAGAWAVRLPPANAASASAIRLWPGVYARAEETGAVWLRGGELTAALDLELRKLPGAQRFTIDSGDSGDVVTPVGRRIPTGTLADGGWKPIADWCRTALPPSALPARPPVRVSLSLVRCDQAAEATVLVATLAEWTGWAADAPLVRLRRLSFAASADGRVVVRGSPLPPIAGIQYVERQGVAVPAGWKLQPAVDPATVHAVLMTSEADVALLVEDGSWERIDADQFVAASRSAARATK